MTLDAVFNPISDNLKKGKHDIYAVIENYKIFEELAKEPEF